MQNIYYTKEELIKAGTIASRPYSVMAAAFTALANDNLDSVHIPHSDVYFVREAMHKRSGLFFPLGDVERAMKAEGWKDRGKVLKKAL